MDGDAIVSPGDDPIVPLVDDAKTPRRELSAMAARDHEAQHQRERVALTPIEVKASSKDAKHKRR